MMMSRDALGTVGSPENHNMLLLSSILKGHLYGSSLQGWESDCVQCKKKRMDRGGLLFAILIYSFCFSDSDNLVIVRERLIVKFNLEI